MGGTHDGQHLTMGNTPEGQHPGDRFGYHRQIYHFNGNQTSLVTIRNFKNMFL